MFETFCILTAIYVIGVIIVSSVKSIHIPAPKAGVNVKLISVRNPVSKDGKYKVVRSVYDKGIKKFIASIELPVGVLKISSDTLEGLEEGIDVYYKRLADGEDLYKTHRIRYVDD